VYPSGERQRTGRFDALPTQAQRRAQAGHQLWKDVIAGLPPGNDSYALIPLDQLARPAQHIADFTPHGQHRAGHRRATQPCRQQANPEVLWMAPGRLPPAHLAACGCTQIGQIRIGSTALVPKQDRRQIGGSARVLHDHA